jgi:hypothetical protein
MHAPELSPQCGAKTRQGGRCRNRPMINRQRCRMHGGASPRGLASPHFKHGRYTRDWLTLLVGWYLHTCGCGATEALHGQV